MVLAILSVFRFWALRAQKRNTKEDEVPLRKITSGLPRKPCYLAYLMPHCSVCRQSCHEKMNRLFSRCGRASRNLNVITAAKSYDRPSCLACLLAQSKE